MKQEGKYGTFANSHEKPENDVTRAAKVAVREKIVPICNMFFLPMTEETFQKIFKWYKKPSLFGVQ